MVILKIYLGFCLVIIIAGITFIITYYRGTRPKLCDSCRRLTKKYSKRGKNGIHVPRKSILTSADAQNFVENTIQKLGKRLVL